MSNVRLLLLRCAAPVVGALTVMTFSPISASLAQGISESKFGKLPDGRPVVRYTLHNAAGSEAAILSLGATLQALRVPDRSGKLVDVVLGYDSLAEYLDGKAYFGATVGRYANRIARAEFSIGEKTYHLPANNGDNTLHGGTIGFSRVLWDRVTAFKAANSVQLRYVSSDGDQGFPGKLTVMVTYTLTEANELKIAYEARTSAPTVVNLTNHSYFNLGGAGVGDVSRDLITIQANAYTPVDAAAIPTGEIRPVDGTDFDFRTPKSLAEHLKSATDPSVQKSEGYDINLVLNDSPRLRHVASVQDPVNGLSMEVSTTEPGVQLFTPNFPRGRLTGKDGRDYGSHGAICLETEHFPDSPHEPQFPSTLLKPGQTLHSETIYQFSTEAPH